MIPEPLAQTNNVVIAQKMSFVEEPSNTAEQVTQGRISMSKVAGSTYTG
jgi:hypothetical protein